MVHCRSILDFKKINLDWYFLLLLFTAEHVGLYQNKLKESVFFVRPARITDESIDIGLRQIVLLWLQALEK